MRAIVKFYNGYTAIINYTVINAVQTLVNDDTLVASVMHTRTGLHVYQSVDINKAVSVTIDSTDTRTSVDVFVDNAGDDFGVRSNVGTSYYDGTPCHYEITPNGNMSCEYQLVTDDGEQFGTNLLHHNTVTSATVTLAVWLAGEAMDTFDTEDDGVRLAAVVAMHKRLHRKQSTRELAEQFAFACGCDWLNVD